MFGSKLSVAVATGLLVALFTVPATALADREDTVSQCVIPGTVGQVCLNVWTAEERTFIKVFLTVQPCDIKTVISYNDTNEDHIPDPFPFEDGDPKITTNQSQCEGIPLPP